jgi:AraC-like DNA-binding protein
MNSIRYHLTSYTEIFAKLAKLFHTTPDDNIINIPPHLGQGFLKLIQLNNGLDAIVYDFTLKENFVLSRTSNETEYYTLVLDEVNTSGGLSITIDSEKIPENTLRPIAFYLTSFMFDVETILYKNVNIKGTRIMLTEEWMKKYLQLDEKESVLEKYISMKAAGINYKPVSDEVRNLLHDVVQAQPDTPLLFYINKLLLIVERFFEWLYDEMKVIADKSGISRHDIEMAQKIENILTNDITKLPPTIKELAKEVAMSESKLKKVFKSVYGLPPYEYYQKQRMQKAKMMLLSGNYSIKDIGYTLGYSNLSNFTLAFKKVYDRLPSEVLKNAVR